MEPRIERLEPKKLVGMRLTMTLAQDRTAALWQSFMPRRSEILHRLGSYYLNMQVYTELPDASFTPDTPFEKWATVEVMQHTTVPPGMEPYTLAGGTYAVFDHKGPAHTFPKTALYIYGTWLPGSGYKLDHREHFERLEEGYHPADPDAEEEVWIPIR